MHTARAARAGISALSSALSCGTASFAKGKAVVRPTNLQPLDTNLRQIGCSFWTHRAYSSNTATKHQTEVGLFEDDAEEDFYTEDEPQAADLARRSADSGGNTTPSAGDGVGKRPRLPTSQKKLNRLLSRHVMHDVLEDELEEKFVKGSGPGGQAINKTNSAVHLLHVPTGIRIRAQPSRLRGKNREAARKLLREKLDDLRARGVYPLSEGSSNGSLAQEVIINPDGGLDAGEMAEEKEDEMVAPILDKRATKQAKKESKKAREAMLATSYSRTEIQVAKIRARKANKGKKQKKKIREKEAARADAEAAALTSTVNEAEAQSASL